MPLDVAALRKAVKRLKTAHAERPDARRTTGATALIRAALPEIRRLRNAEGQPWAVIAGALAEQGVTQGADAKPITADRLIALVRQIEAQIARKDVVLVGRYKRGDVAGPTSDARMPSSQPEPVPSAGKPRLSAELQSRPESVSDDQPMSEAEIRQLQADKHRHLFKKD